MTVRLNAVANLFIFSVVDAKPSLFIYSSLRASNTLFFLVIPQSSSAHDAALAMDVDPVAPNALESMDVDRPVTHDCYNTMRQAP